MKEVTLRNKKKKKKFMEQLLKKEEGRKKQKKSVSFCHQRVDGTTHTSDCSFCNWVQVFQNNLQYDEGGHCTEDEEE